MKKILFFVILTLFLSSPNIFSRGSGISVFCDYFSFPLEKCYSYVDMDRTVNVWGRATITSGGSEVTSCPSGNTEISNIFIYDNTVGDGSGYSSGFGCKNTLSDSSVVFSPDNGVVVEHNFATWLSTIVSNH